ncbi:hypothetical protein GOP47_0013109 [Adiantum capillus-veneris]|uniref:SMP-LTD domain-containing protein n=1 Tax=Adiantum capillus-veneris TaxID=13818 RepID=A0A9D4URX4_ADICA|nr:hypothetical protein GOP47_0012813 [Adiantum capillus-veneris]KAI5073003.1 hypothetical protein GOP47_0013109 [Adiantum capillus-veneris]
MLLSWLTGFLAGFLCLAIIELCAIAFLLRHLFRARHRPSSASAAENVCVTYQPPHIFLQGDMWVAALPASTARKDAIRVVAKDHRRRKDTSDDCIEIYPSRRHAQLQNNVLTLVAEDGCEERIDLRGCSVQSVSGGKEMARKWAKKYPIQLESFNQHLLVKSSVCLLYFETSWEKETWCQVLRAAAGWSTEKGNWYVDQKREFHDYCSRVDKAYPTFAKFAGVKSKHLEDDKAGKLDKNMAAALSRRQRIWRRITKKSLSKESAFVYKEGSGAGDLSSSLVVSKAGPERQDESIKQPSLASYSLDSSFGYESAGSSSFQSNSEKNFVEDGHSLSDSWRSDYQIVPDLAMTVSDQGTMCWNLICSRLFFDGYHSLRFQEACHKLIQKQFSKIVTPAYMGKINCTKLELGSIPPIIHSMQVLPKDSDFICSFDAVVEYSGGLQIKIDTRLDVRDSASQEKVLNQSLEPTLAGAAAADILRAGLETIGSSADTNVVRSTDTESGEAGSEKAQPSRGRWKTMLARVADQVSLVPFTLSMRLVSLKGTLRVRIKPPPTEHIWFGFTSMPTIELQPEPSIGEHRITKGPVIAFITNKIKMLIQDTLVLPNCEGIWVPWMISETDDWIPQTAMPVPWSPLETRDSLPREESQAMRESAVNTITETLLSSKTGNVSPVLEEPDQLHELEEPLLENNNVISDGESLASTDVPSPAGHVRLRNVSGNDWMDANNRSSRRTKMLSLGKKMTEKLDEKRRLVVEKMREGLEKYEQGGK